MLDPRLAVVPQLTRILREAIVGNAIPAGARLSETEISRQYGVSRQPVREAFIRLADDGLLEVRPQRGTFVRRISLRAVEDARFIREAVETDLVGVLALDHDATLIAQLRAQLRDQETVANGRDRSAFRALDDLFHATLVRGAGRADLWQILDGVKAQMDRVRHLTIQTLDISRLVIQHRRIVDAVEAGDRVLAERAMRTHLRTILADLDLHLAERPQLFDDIDTPWRQIRRPALGPGRT